MKNSGHNVNRACTNSINSSFFMQNLLTRTCFQSLKLPLGFLFLQHMTRVTLLGALWLWHDKKTSRPITAEWCQTHQRGNLYVFVELFKEIAGKPFFASGIHHVYEAFFIPGGLNLLCFFFRLALVLRPWAMCYVQRATWKRVGKWPSSIWNHQDWID